MKKILISLLVLIIVVRVLAQNNKTITIQVTDKVKFDMVQIQPDTFIRKNVYGDTICHFCHICPVISKGGYNGYDTIVLKNYYIGKYEVTRKLYSTVMHTDPSYFKKSAYSSYPEKNTAENHPVETVSWYDAERFIDTLSKITGLDFRLPSEAEWQYAGWGGNPNLKYSGSNDATQVAWTITDGFTHNVGTKKPNGYGLYDMSGNVSEWCSDWFSSDYYVTDTLYNNPIGPLSGVFKVVKGGSWGHDKRFLEVITRVGTRPEEQSNGIGFRLALDADQIKK